MATSTAPRPRAKGARSRSTTRAASAHTASSRSRGSGHSSMAATFASASRYGSTGMARWAIASLTHLEYHPPLTLPAGRATASLAVDRAHQGLSWLGGRRSGRTLGKPRVNGECAQAELNPNWSAIRQGAPRRVGVVDHRGAALACSADAGRDDPDRSREGQEVPVTESADRSEGAPSGQRVIFRLVPGHAGRMDFRALDAHARRSGQGLELEDERIVRCGNQLPLQFAAGPFAWPRLQLDTDPAAPGAALRLVRLAQESCRRVARGAARNEEA